MTEKAEKKETVASLSFEQALGELEHIVRRLEGGSQDLDSAIKDYTRGTQLKSHCDKKLNEAKLKVEKIVAGADGALKTEPFDAE